jgi:agmatinase
MSNKTKTYAGIPEEYHEYANSKVVLQPVIYDGTSTWGKGANRGPAAFLEASENMELFDIPTRSEAWKQGIHLASELKGFDRPDQMVEAVYSQVKKYLIDEKLVTLFGGEHSVSIGSMRAVGELDPDITFVQIDAHADLRPAYEGTPYNHACAMSEISRSHPILQVGIRSMDVSEWPLMDHERVYFMHEIREQSDWMSHAVKQCTDKIYITVDLDAFDSSLMPATGTPEPGGFYYYEVLDFISQLARHKDVIGFDIVELAPQSNSRAADFLAAKLYYQMLSQIFHHKS